MNIFYAYFNNRNFMKKVLLATWTLRDRYIVIEGLYTESTFFVKLAVPDCLAAAWMKLWGGQMSGGKVYILAKDVNTERKFEIKAKKNRPEKGLFLGAPLFRQFKSNCSDFLLPNYHHIAKYFLHERISLFHRSYIISAKGPGLLRVKEILYRYYQYFSRNEIRFIWKCYILAIWNVLYADTASVIKPYQNPVYKCTGSP